MDRESARKFFTGIVAMAPMAQGGNLPYRRMCREYGAVRTCSEMVLAHKLVKGGERPLLKHHSITWPHHTNHCSSCAGFGANVQPCQVRDQASTCADE